MLSLGLTAPCSSPLRPARDAGSFRFDFAAQTRAARRTTSRAALMRGSLSFEAPSNAAIISVPVAQVSSFHFKWSFNATAVTATLPRAMADCKWNAVSPYAVEYSSTWRLTAAPVAAAASRTLRSVLLALKRNDSTAASDTSVRTTLDFAMGKTPCRFVPAPLFGCQLLPCCTCNLYL